MKYLVLGATGLVGSKIIEKLDPKNEVVAFCRRDFDFPSHVQKNIVNFEWKKIGVKSNSDRVHVRFCILYIEGEKIPTTRS